MSSVYGEVVFEACGFAMNHVTDGGLVIAEGGKLEMQVLRLEENSFETSEGIFVISGDTVLNSSRSTCSYNNTLNDSAADTCQGIYVKESKECIDFDPCESLPPSQNPTVAPTSAPSFVARDCYDTLQGLQAAIIDAEGRDTLTTIRVCPSSTLDGNAEYDFSPIQLSMGDIQLECGTGGTLSEGCIIFGGVNAQFYIGPKVRSVSFSGFSMVGASTISVIGAGSKDSVATFRNCQWRVSHPSAICWCGAVGIPLISSLNSIILRLPLCSCTTKQVQKHTQGNGT